MDMVLVCAYFKKMDLVPIGESYTRLFQNHVHFLGHHYLAIFGRTDEVIDENADIVTFVDVDAHALSIYHPRQAAGNYTLREIKNLSSPQAIFVSKNEKSLGKSITGNNNSWPYSCQPR